jgi:hypothetical protein
VNLLANGQIFVQDHLVRIVDQVSAALPVTPKTITPGVSMPPVPSRTGTVVPPL